MIEYIFIYLFLNVILHVCLHDYVICVCKCVSAFECKLCYITYVVVQRVKRKKAVAILVLQFSYFNLHMNFSLCKLTIYMFFSLAN